MHKHPRILRSSIIYLSGGILNKALPFLLLPILTRVLSTSEYGLVSLFQVLLAFVVPIVGMGMQINITRNFPQLAKAELAKVIGNLTLVLLGTTTLLTFVLFLYFFFSSSLFGIPKKWVYLMLVITFFNQIYVFNQTVFLNQDRPFIFGVFESGNTLINFISSIILVVSLGYGWQGRVIGIALAAVIMGSTSLYLMIHNQLFKVKYSWVIIKGILKLSLPLIPHALGGTIIVMSDRLFIDRMVGREAVGIYTVGYTFGMIVGLVVESFNKAWAPWIYRQLSSINDTKKVLIVKYTYLYFSAILALALGVAGLSQFALKYMVTPKFYPATEFVVWVALGYAFRGMYTMVFPYLVHQAKTNFLPLITSVAAVINLVANYFLIKINGPVGAAQATIIAFLVSFLLTWWYAQKIYPMPWQLGWKQQ